MTAKIKMQQPLVELDGDEMAHILWRMIKEILLEPYIDLYTEYYDLSLPNRDTTKDQVTIDAARALQKYGVGVKCATITPNTKRLQEYGLQQIWKSPNATIRTALDGTVFRKPIITRSIRPLVKNWLNPITIARHAYGDIYKGSEYRVDSPGRAELVFTSENGAVNRQTVHEFTGSGVLLGMHNLDESIANFARACFTYALDVKEDLWFAAKDTISSTYDRAFKDIFADIFAAEYQEQFCACNIHYRYLLIDDAVARIMRSSGKMVWACKNYDGDVMSDMVAAAFGSLAMMTSVLVSPAGCYMFEAAHGTVQKHYADHLAGKPTSTNPMASLFAWTGALKKRSEMDDNLPLQEFAARLETASLQTIEGGIMTQDLVWVSDSPSKKAVSTAEFLTSVKSRL